MSTNRFSPNGVARVIYDFAEWVSKDRGSLLKPDAVLFNILGCFLRVPLKL
jgi:hypothetical protein